MQVVDKLLRIGRCAKLKPRLFEREWPVALLDARLLENCKVYPSRAFAMAQLPKGGVVAEIGVDKGIFSEFIWKTVRPKRLHLFDLDISDQVTERFSPDCDRELVYHRGDSSTELAKLPDLSFDWIYVDGDHSIEGVEKDIRVSKHKIKPDGLLIFNDYTVWSPLDVIPFGIPKAVHRLCSEEGFEFVYLALNELGYHDVAIRRIKPPSQNG